MFKYENDDSIGIIWFCRWLNYKFLFLNFLKFNERKKEIKNSEW